SYRHVFVVCDIENSLLLVDCQAAREIESRKQSQTVAELVSASACERRNVARCVDSAKVSYSEFRNIQDSGRVKRQADRLGKDRLALETVQHLPAAASGNRTR